MLLLESLAEASSQFAKANNNNNQPAKASKPFSPGLWRVFVHPSDVQVWQLVSHVSVASVCAHVAYGIDLSGLSMSFFIRLTLSRCSSPASV